jgi:hypothetical protein
MFAQRRQVFGSDSVTVQEVSKPATRTCTPLGTPFSPTREPELALPELREALLAVAGHGGAINGRRLGQWLLARRDRVIDGRTIVRAGLSGGSMTSQLMDDAATAEAA